MNPRDGQVDAVAVEDGAQAHPTAYPAVVGGVGSPPEVCTLAAEAQAHGWQEKDTPVGAPARPQTVAGTRGAATAR